MRRLIFLGFDLFFWTFFILTSIVFYCGALLLRIFTLPFDPNRRVLQQYSCFWASLYLWVNPFWSLKTSGQGHVDRKKAYVIVSNHQSFVDILVLFATFLHFKWVSKASVFYSPFIGWNMWLNGYVPILRGDKASREKCMDKCKRWLKKGSSVLFFPEGTRSPDGKLQSFKLGAFRLALEAGVALLPIVIQGTNQAVPKHTRSLTNRAQMSVKFLAPIPVHAMPGSDLQVEAQRLADQVAQVIAEELNASRSESAA